MSDTDLELERRLRTAFREGREHVHAPTELRTAVLSIPASDAASRQGSRTRRRGLTLLAATMAIGAGALGWALLGGSRPPEPDPSPPAFVVDPTASATPQPSETPLATGDPADPSDGPASTDGPTASDGPIVALPGDTDAGLAAGWVPAGTMAEARSLPTATLLRDGRVLVAGGFSVADGHGLATAELWDPATRTFSPAGTMSRARSGHAAALLDDGRVLIVGGDLRREDGDQLPVDVWDPAIGGFDSVGTMPALPFGLTATSLLDGRVLIVGDDACLGASRRERFGILECIGDSSATWLWSPDGTWEVGPPLNEPRQWHTATRVPDGRVLIVGNPSWGMETPESAEVYDPAVNQFIRVDEPRDYVGGAQSATLLGDGRVLITGGDTADPNGPKGPAWMGPLRTAEVWDPATGTFRRAGRMDHARRGHQATLLPDGRVLVVGGSGPRTSDFHDTPRASTEIWDPRTRAFEAGPALGTPRQMMALVTLPDGSVLVIGGSSDANARTGALDALASTELLDLSPAP
jgi:hypothetical protein